MDMLSLNATASMLEQTASPLQMLPLICQRMGLESPKMVKHPDQVHLPMLAYTPELGWGVVVDRNARGQWVVMTPKGGKPVDEAALKNASTRYRAACTVERAVMTPKLAPSSTAEKT